MKFNRISNITVYAFCLGVCIAHGSELDERQQALEYSLQEFDEKILRELEEAQEERQENAREKAAMRDDAELEAEDESAEGQGQNEAEGEGQAASAEGSQSGEESNEAESAAAGQESNEATSTTGQESSDKTSGGVPTETETGQSEQSVAEGQEPKGNTHTPVADIPTGDDDDVVARQLREAAEAETDPEVKEKLWEEYRKYKNQRNPGP